MNSDLFQGFYLGDLLVDPAKGYVTGQAGTVHLPSKAMEVLLVLASNTGTLVTREALLDEVWGTGHGSREALSHTVGEIRHALDDHADEPQYIQTLPKRGYRLIVAVEPFESAEEHRASAIVVETGNLSAIWSVLKERNVVRVSIAYAAASWLLLQFAEIVFDALAFPEWSMRVFIVVLAVGFLLAVVIAWLYQVVPEGAVGGAKTPRRLQHAVDIGIIAVLALGVGLLGYRQFVLEPVFEVTDRRISIATQSQPDEHSVAVLRFVNLGADPRFSDGLSESLLHLLARFHEITVPSRTTTWSLSDKTVDVVDLATRLHVRYVLEGSVQQDQDQIRVVAQLIDGISGNHVWSQNYDENLSAETFFSTQDDIAIQVAEQIKATISESSLQLMVRSRTANFPALNDYLWGRMYLRQPKTDQSIIGAIDSFENAIGEDPEYVEAMAGLCEAHLASFDYTRGEDNFVNAERACLRAAAIDDTLGEVYAATGNLYRIAGRYDEAELNLLKALELLPDSAPILEILGRTYRAASKLALAETVFEEAINAEPGSWSVYKSMGNFLFRTGRYKEAIPFYRQVISLEGDSSPGYNNLAVTYFMLGRFDDANAIWASVLEESPTRLTYLNYGNSLYYSRDYELSADIYEKALDMDDSDHRVWGNLAQSLRFVSGREEEAVTAWERAVELAESNLTVNPKNTETLSHIAAAYARIGKMQLAERSLDRLFALGWENPNTSFFVALTYYLLGREDDAIRELEQAVAMGFPTTLIAWDPDFQAMSNNRRYIALLQTAESIPGS